MSNGETINKKSVLGSKTIFKDGIEGKEYSALLKDKSRRRRAPRSIKDEVDVQSTCPFCGSTEILIDVTRSEKVCRKCGVVLEENIIDSTVRGTARDKDGNSLGQNGAPSNIAVHDGGITTTFNIKEGNVKDRAKWIRIKRMHNQSRVIGSREKNFARAFSELALISSNLSLAKNVRDESASIYRKAVTKGLVRGRSINKLLVATIYIACRECRVPRTLDEMNEVTGVDKKTIAKNYRFLSRELGLNLPIISPNDYVPRFASKLGLSSEVVVKSMGIIDQAKELGLTSGKDPASIAAATLYASSILLGERRTQTEIARSLGVTEVTIRNRFKELNSELNFI